MGIARRCSLYVLTLSCSRSSGGEGFWSLSPAFEEGAVAVADTIPAWSNDESILAILLGVTEGSEAGAEVEEGIGSTLDEASIWVGGKCEGNAVDEDDCEGYNDGSGHGAAGEEEAGGWTTDA